MKSKYQVKIGYAPTRRDIYPPPEFSWPMRDKIKERMDRIFSRIHDVELVGIEWLNEEGLLVDPADVKRVAKKFKDEEVDAVFVPHCNFGCEEVVGMLGKAVGKPVLLWGPRDDVPPTDLTIDRPLDIQCGLFASGMALRRYNVPFTYIENCWLDDPMLEKEIDKFVRVVSVVKAFNSLRIGQISLRPAPFLSVKINESELMERFGIEIVPIKGQDIIALTRDFLNNRKEEVAVTAEEIRSKVDCVEVSEDYLNNTAALELAILEMAEKQGCVAFGSECWEVIPQALDIWPCFAFGELADKGIPVSCETDMHGAISCVLAQAAARGETASFTADLTIRHPFNDNSELLWHCGPFPISLAKENKKTCLVGKCNGQYEIRGGDLTIIRLGALGGKYTLLVEEVKGCDGPITNGNYVWVETKDWPALERKFVCGPYIHHVAGIHGKYFEVFREAEKYLKGIEIDYVK